MLNVNLLLNSALMKVLSLRVVIKYFDIDIFVKCNWVNTRWQWFVHIYTQKLHTLRSYI
jgi:hypothetical protein